MATPSTQDLGQDPIVLGLSIMTLIAAVAAAIYAFRTYQLKSGVEIRGSYSLVRSIAAQDAYVGQVTLENLKDRAAVIFKILLEVGNGYYIEIEDFERPLILEPFGAFRRDYDPIDLYSVGMRRIRMEGLLGNPKVRHRLVLSTSQGRYNVGRYINRWEPIADLFRNYLTALVTPLRSTYEGKAYGSRTKYIVTLETEGGRKEVIPVYSRDYQTRKFRGFQLTPESLQSRDALEVFLLERAVAGELRCSDLTVLDLEEWRKDIYREQDKEAIKAGPRSWFTYRILGWLQTRAEDCRLRRSNQELLRRHREALHARGAPRQQKA